MDLFKWVGRKKREEEWMRQPRRVPEFARDLPEDSDRWFMTREYVNDEDKNFRMYLAAWQPDPKVESWEIIHVEYNLKHDRISTSTYAWDVADPLEVLKSLRTYEKKSAANAALIQHPEGYATYRAFANKHGIHIDDDGNLFRVQAETPLAKGTFMNREALDKLFNKDAAKVIPLDSWEGLYKGLIDSFSPGWTMTEKGFGPPAQFQDVKAVPVENAHEAQAVAINPVATSVWEVAEQGGGVVNWKGGVATLPTAQEIYEAKQKLANGTAGKPVLEAAPVEKPAVEAAPAEKPLAAAVPESDAPVAEKTVTEKPAEVKPPEPPLPVRVDGKFVYQHAREKSWGNYQEMKQMTWQRPVTLEDLAAGKGYPEYAYYMEQMIEKLKELPDTLTSKTVDRYAKELAVKEMSRYAVNVPFRSARRNLAKHECDGTILVGMLRAGAAVYAENFGPGKKFTPEGLQLMSTIGKICVQFAIDRMGVEPGEAAKIADIITKGKDTFGPELPLEKVFAKFPAADFTPLPQPYVVNPPPKKKAAAPKKPPQARRRGWDEGW